MTDLIHSLALGYHPKARVFILQSDAATGEGVDIVKGLLLIGGVALYSLFSAVTTEPNKHNCGGEKIYSGAHGFRGSFLRA